MSTISTTVTDQVRGEWKLDGWAHDEAHPELPVLLEILLEGKVIGSAARLSTLQVRRAVDGAPVEVSRAILDAAAGPEVVRPRLAMVA
jgi:hypothetical protein